MLSFSSSVIFLIDYQVCLLFSAFLSFLDLVLVSFCSLCFFDWGKFYSSQWCVHEWEAVGAKCGPKKPEASTWGYIASEHFYAKSAPLSRQDAWVSKGFSTALWLCMVHGQAPYHILFPDLQLVFISWRNSDRKVQKTSQGREKNGLPSACFCEEDGVSSFFFLLADTFLKGSKYYIYPIISSWNSTSCTAPMLHLATLLPSHSFFIT